MIFKLIKVEKNNLNKTKKTFYPLKRCGLFLKKT